MGAQSISSMTLEDTNKFLGKLIPQLMYKFPPIPGERENELLQMMVIGTILVRQMPRWTTLSETLERVTAEATKDPRFDILFTPEDRGSNVIEKMATSMQEVIEEALKDSGFGE